MDRRGFLRLTVAGSIFSTSLAHAQTRKGKARVAILLATSMQATRQPFDALTRRLAELGWTDKNLELVTREAQGDAQRFGPIADELIALKPDLIFAPFVFAALEVKKRTREVPIIFAVAPDPVGLGLVESLARPGGNATGPSVHGVELAGKRIQLLKEMAPTVRRVGRRRNRALTPIF